MTDTITTPDPDEPNADNTPDEPNADDTPDEPNADDWDPPTRDEWERLRTKAKERDKKLREAQAKIAELSKGGQDKAEPSEADKLRAALVRTASASALAAAGITSKADQDVILSIPGMTDGLDVGDDGTVDTDALADRLSALRRIFTPKVSRNVNPRVGQGDPGTADPDRERYERIMGIRR